MPEDKLLEKHYMVKKPTFEKVRKDAKEEMRAPGNHVAILLDRYFELVEMAGSYKALKNIVNEGN
ncbi:hypothetical protein KAR91_02370 [Candidatus Pacearchaeota archaeon]|nr:hypothetical protein [Candidatus Pacearchaeota archaeon]